MREVFARVRKGDDSVADLYAEDGVVTYPGGKVEGREAIRAFYKGTIERIRPQPQVEVVFEAPPLFVAIVNVPTLDEYRRALDLFELGDAGIRRLEIYSQDTS